MKFAQLDYFFHKMFGETKDTMSTLPKSWGDMFSVHHKLGPCNVAYFLRIFVLFEFIRNAFSNTCLVFDIAVQVCDRI